MKLIFEQGNEGRMLSLLPECDVPECVISEKHRRAESAKLPQVSENDISRHYTALAKRVHGVNDGFYPLGSCTMKYNPKVNEEMAALPGFTGIHPLQPADTVSGALELMRLSEKYLCEITGMDAMTMQPAAGAHGEFTGLMLIKAYHEDRGDYKRDKIIVPDSAHGTNPASAVMAGFTVISIPSGDDGCVDLEKLAEAVGDDTAGLMLTNPNTVGLFDRNILKITRIVHEAGGLTYYDGANINAVMGIARPGDMGYDVVHINLHKTFSTPHGGGGPGSGPVGCKAFLADYLPDGVCGGDVCDGDVCDGDVCDGDVCDGGRKDCANSVHRTITHEKSIGAVRSFYGNFLVIVKAFTYITMLGREGIPQASMNAVLNANYMKSSLSDIYDMAYNTTCMHEFVISMERLKEETGATALDVAKALLDCGIHPATIYFPLIVHEAFMIEPTETESKVTLDEAIEALRNIYETACENGEALHASPITTPIGRPDEVKAAREPVLTFKG